MIKIYTLPLCPKCNIIKEKMKSKNILFEEISEEKIIEEKGFVFLPVIETKEGDLITSFSEINKYINDR